MKELMKNWKITKEELKILKVKNSLKMKKLTIVLFVISVSIFFAPPPALAARKRVRVKASAGEGDGGAVRRSIYGGASSSVKFRADRKAFILTLSNMGNISSVSYQLTYLANGVSQGVMGKINPSIEPTASRELLFGTCSHGVCTYHTNIANARLKVSSLLTSGVTVIKPYRIRP